MRKSIYLFVLIILCAIVSPVAAADTCSIELFPDQMVSKLFWDQVGESFIVGLGHRYANEYTYDYQRVSYSNNEIKISDYALYDPIQIEDLVTRLGISEQFYGNYDQTQLFLSPDSQTALYIQNVNQLHIVNLTDQTSIELRLAFPVGEIEQIIWRNAEKVLLVPTFPYGSGYQIAEVDLAQNRVSYPTDVLDLLLGRPAISPDTHFAIAANAAPDVSQPFKLILIDLIETTYQLSEIPFFARYDLEPVWSLSGDEIYIIGSIIDSSFNVIDGIYKLTFEEQNVINPTQVVELYDDFAYDNTLWLVDPVNQRSIHAGRNGGLTILCWGSAAA